MLTTTIAQLEGKYKELFKREQDIAPQTPESPGSIQGKRKRFIDYLFDEVLSQEDIFESFSAIGATQHKVDHLVLKYQSAPGYSRLHEEGGNVSHYQYLAFKQSSPFPWLPDFLILRDRNTSVVRLYIISSRGSWFKNPNIGTDKDLELSFEMPYFHEGKHQVERGGITVKEVSPAELCDPHYIFRSDYTSGEEGRMFQCFYFGLQEFAKKNLDKMRELKGSINPEEIDRGYKALQAIVGK